MSMHEDDVRRTEKEGVARQDGGSLDLLPQHRALIDGSAISDEVAEARGYRSITIRSEARRLGFSDAQCNVPALLIPIRNVRGEISTYQLRPDAPRVRDGKPLKYETPAGSRMALDVPLAARLWLRDPKRPLFVTEGARKADAAVSKGLCCIALLGVWNFRGTNDQGGKTTLPDWDDIALDARTVYVVFDSDVMEKPAVGKALVRLAGMLAARKATVRPIYLPPGEAGGKQGIDDFFAAGGSVGALLRYAEPTLRPTADDAGDDADGAYAIRDGRHCFRRRERSGDTWQPLCNFTARITAEVVADDGLTERGELLIEGALATGEPLPPVRVPLSRFASMNWVVPQWGTRAIVEAGIGAADRLRAAIQHGSPDAERRRVYEHPGWRNLPEHGWCFLHADGAIGAAGSVQGIEVELTGPAARVALPDPPSGDALHGAFRALLDLLDLAPAPIMAPLVGAALRAPLNQVMPADLALFLLGRTGLFKTELAALVMRVFGVGFDRLHLPASWTATANALERAAFDFKDCPLVIDDFAPVGSPREVDQLHAKAERVLHGAGNASGRGRMSADGRLRPDYPPRGLVIATGEDVPRGHSAQARAVVIELSAGDVDQGRLTECQATAAQGTYAAAMAGYLRWLAPRLDGLRTQLPGELASLRTEALRAGMHARTPEATANLGAGWRLFLQFAVDAGALTEPDAKRTWGRVWEALREAAARQAGHHAEQEVTLRFLTLLASALASGEAHVAGPNGGEPEMPEAWGWRERIVGSGDYERQEWQPQGRGVGWLDGGDLYLDIEAAVTATQRIGQANGGGIAIGARTLAKRLHERGLLRSTEQEHGDLKVRRTLQGARRRVLHITAETVVGEKSGQSGQSGHVGRDGSRAAEHAGKAGSGRDRDGMEMEAGGRKNWPELVEPSARSGRKIRPIDAQIGAAGRSGRIGDAVEHAAIERKTTGEGGAMGGSDASEPDTTNSAARRGMFDALEPTGVAGDDRWTI